MQFLTVSALSFSAGWASRTCYRRGSSHLNRIAETNCRPCLRNPLMLFPDIFLATGIPRTLPLGRSGFCAGTEKVGVDCNYRTQRSEFRAA